MQNVAIYMDIENIGSSRFDAVHGKQAWTQRMYDRNVPRKEKEKLIEAARLDIEAIVAHGRSLGTIVVNRAYADWSMWWNGSYGRALADNGVELVQLFPLSGRKNGADIRLAVDVVDDLHVRSHISDVLLLAGDSDYVGLAQRCRALGRGFHALGVTACSSPRLGAACSSFTKYEEIIPAPVAIEAAPETAHSAWTLEELVHEAVRHGSAASPSGWLLQARIKPLLKQLDPTFDLAALGYDRIGAFLDAYEEASQVEHRQGDHDREYRLVPQPVALELVK